MWGQINSSESLPWSSRFYAIGHDEATSTFYQRLSFKSRPQPHPSWSGCCLCLFETLPEVGDLEPKFVFFSLIQPQLRCKAKLFLEKVGKSFALSASKGVGSGFFITQNPQDLLESHGPAVIVSNNAYFSMSPTRQKCWRPSKVLKASDQNPELDVMSVLTELGNRGSSRLLPKWKGQQVCRTASIFWFHNRVLIC